MLRKFKIVPGIVSKINPYYLRLPINLHRKPEPSGFAKLLVIGNW